MDALVAELREQIRRAAARHGHGRWRLRDHLIDRPCDLLVDHLLQHTAPADIDYLGAWLAKICLNLARSGPPRADLDRRIDSATAEDLLAYAAFPPPPPQGQQILAPLLPIADPILTPDEQRTLTAVRTVDSISAAALEAGMTPRDLRVRLNRAALELRRARAHAATPHNSHHGAFPGRS